MPGSLPSVRRGSVIRFATLVLLIAGLGAVTLSLGPDRQALLAVIGDSPVFAPVAAVLGSAVLVAALVPRTLLALVGGALFGTVTGSVYVLIGITVGSFAAYLVGRGLGRDFVERRLRGRLALVEAAVCRRGTGAVVISRLIPMVPFAISNYAFGTTAMRARQFLLGTMLGVIPGNVAYAALGSATMHGDGFGTRVAGACVICLGVGGSIGTYLVWRRRPRHAAIPATVPATLPVGSGAVEQ